MSEDGVRKVLKDLGLTEKEVDIYIFLAKHGAMKGGEIAKKTKTHKALVYRILGSLQGKGVVKSTIEVPARFAAEPFEAILDLNIKIKQEEAALLENTKIELLSYWKKMSQAVPEPNIEKFVVIEGNHRIYPKISQMIKETKSQFSAIVTVPGLARADQYGLFDTVLGQPSKSKIQFRFLTELGPHNSDAIKAFIKKIPKTKLRIKVRNPEMGLQLEPRMVIRDEDEMLFFVTPRTEIAVSEQDEVCLWTNCAELIRAFKVVFDEGWRNSSDLEMAILEKGLDKLMQGASVTNDSEFARRNYEEIVASANKEILMLTSSTELATYPKKLALMKKLAARGVSVKIMAPITSENLKATNKLSKFCEVKHVPATYLKTTLIDGSHIFQFEKRTRFKRTIDDRGKIVEAPESRNIAYSNNSAYVEKMKALLEDIWENSVEPSNVTLNSILDSASTVILPPEHTATGPVEDSQFGFPTYCSAQAIIHTPPRLNMPDMLFELTHFGEPTDEKANWMSISLWLNTPKGYAFIPTAIVLSRGRKDRRALLFERLNKILFSGTPAGQNVLLVKEQEFQMMKQGNTLFAGWTVSIPILPSKVLLPPSSLIFEGYGNSTRHRHLEISPSGWKTTIENDGSEAFVTFISTSLRYTGPGTDGRLCTKGFTSITGPTK